MSDCINDLKARIYDLKDELDVSNAVLNDKIDHLEHVINDIYYLFTNLKNEKKDMK